jgi:polysaccharide deacetylase 2 family uncharacterized protein YibQ
MAEATHVSEAEPVAESSSYLPPSQAPWEPTFLALYPRWFKIAFVLTGLSLFLIFNFIRANLAEHQGKPPPTTIVRGDAAELKMENSITNAITSEISEANVSNFDRTAPALNNQDDTSVKLTAVPAPGLSDDTADGSLPRISEDGRMVWRTYARPFNLADRRPRIVMIVGDLGLARAATDRVINDMPPAVTLAFDAQSDVVGAWFTRARQAGHETLLQIPMEPFDYPRSDPGPGTLLTSLPTTDNIARLYKFLRRGTGYVGITTLSGSRFTTDPTKLSPILDALRSRGLMLFDARVAPHSVALDMSRTAKLPSVAANVRIDQDMGLDNIRASLQQLEEIADREGVAVGVMGTAPATVEAVHKWLKTLPSKGFALAPISAIAK